MDELNRIHTLINMFTKYLAKPTHHAGAIILPYMYFILVLHAKLLILTDAFILDIPYFINEDFSSEKGGYVV